MPVANITAIVTVKKIKPSNFKPRRSAMIVPHVSPPVFRQVLVQNELAREKFRRERHPPLPRRGTKAIAKTENTSSPFWLVPLLRASRMPHPGRLDELRSDKISLAKVMVSPASTGLIQRNSRNPGEGPQTATSSPRATASRVSR